MTHVVGYFGWDAGAELVGGYCGDGSGCGVFCCNLHRTLSASAWSLGADL